MNKKVALASDHRGVAFKKQIGDWLNANGYEAVDCGPFTEESVDYTDFIFQASEKLAQGQCWRAIGVCHTGIGSAIAANKLIIWSLLLAQIAGPGA